VAIKVDHFVFLIQSSNDETDIVHSVLESSAKQLDVDRELKMDYRILTRYKKLKKELKMNLTHLNFYKFFLINIFVSLFCLTVIQASAATAENLNQDSAHALQALYKVNPTAALIAKQAKAILVFPKVIKVGLVFGGSYGEGVLMKDGKVNEYFNSVSASWGWQAGTESYAYVVFLMNDKAVKYLNTSKGWEFGVGPRIVVVNEGIAKNLSTTSMKNDAYAFVTDQEGLMASLSFEGTKISRIKW